MRNTKFLVSFHYVHDYINTLFVTIYKEVEIMCQMSVVIEENGEQKVIMENVTRLESTDGNISVSTLFEEPKIIPSSSDAYLLVYLI